MFEAGMLPSGIILTLIGLSFVALVYFILRVVPKIRPISSAQTKPPITPNLPTHNDAVVMVRRGGRIAYINNEARNWFKLQDEIPSLERMARQTRPAETFLGLCAAEGQARFAVNGQWVEGRSYVVAEQDGSALLVSMRQPEIVPPTEEDHSASSQVLDTLSKFGQSMVANLDLETILRAILDSVEQLIPTEFAEVTIWDAENQWLVPYRFFGIPGLDKRLEKTDERYPLGEGYAGYMAQTGQPMLIADVDEQTELRPIIDRKKYPFQSYIGAPLLVGGKLVGTIDLMSQASNSFSENDLNLLTLISGQAAIALHNALLYQDERHRSEELNSLANLTQAIGSVHDPKDLYAHLIDGIAPLLDVEIIGFLIYNENNKKLEAQHPFVGVPPQFVDLYKVSIPTGSPAERIWNRHEIITANNALENSSLIDFGLDHPARAAGIHSTLLVPLSSGGRALGYLQVANK
ncbi:MAG TPA: GAF domain-containing protein, partial [Anaerolineales bacterium]|nr:GAF domain-containing protein [Anaerolineales bacterium]